MSPYSTHEVVKEEIVNARKIQVVRLYDTFSTLIFAKDGSIFCEGPRVSTSRKGNAGKTQAALWMGKELQRNKIRYNGI